MASGSPRTRIGQFYASKKRKPPSPGLKSGRNEKEAKSTQESSPVTKGTLDSYLVTSQDNSNSDKPSFTAQDFLAREHPVKRSLSLGVHSSFRNEHNESLTKKVQSQTSEVVEAIRKESQNNSKSDQPSYTACDLLARHDPIKRSLSLDIDSSLKNEHKEALSAEVQSQTSIAVEAIQKGTFRGFPEASKAAIEGRANDCSVAKCAENSEFKQFAADFLSLYCSNEFHTSVSPSLEPKANDLKRHCSPCLMEEETKASNKRHCLEGETSFSNKITGEMMQSGFVVKNKETVFSSSGKVTAGHEPVVIKGSLKKCNKAPKLGMTECQTPGLLTIKASSHKTPKSMSGSSIFSPGEAFWDEAIDFVDGLCAPMVHLSDQVGQRTSVAESQYNTKKNEPLVDKLKEMRDIRECEVQTRETAALISQGEDTKDVSKEVSPLPVKHFDFLGEDKNLDGGSPNFCAANDSKEVANRADENSECGSVNCNCVQKRNIKTFIEKSQTNEKMVDGVASVHPVTKEKCPLSGQHDGVMISDSPVSEIRFNRKKNEAITPSSFVGIKDHLDLNSWLPSEICSIYRKRGITQLYPWQVDCLQVDGVLQRRNLVYCASTSAGKSFVAEILMLRRVVSTQKMALLVLPYVSICAEKAEHLEGLLEPLNKHVRSYYGNQGGGTLPKDTSVAVCTIEKANSLINRLLEEGRLSEVGIIVIDELHMVGDRSRGYLLELLLTKLRYAAGQGNSESSSGESSGTSSGKTDSSHGLQIVGMSATMPNVAAVADWLQAALYQTNFRPVPLEEYIKVGDIIYDKQMEISRTISKAASLGGKDPDHIVELCNEVVQEGHSVLIFCSSRKGCESTAKHISKFLKKFSISVHNEDSEFLDISAAIDALRRCPVGLDPVLEETLPSGVAYHHAGLTVEEREIVEACYRKGLLRVLTATSTLAAGVNLPARRVIFRQPRIGRDFIDGTRYRQMAGRAGRTGIDTKGESILICKPEEVKRITGLLNESCPPLHSCLSKDKNGMTHAILEVVAGGIVQTASDIHRYVSCTLLNSTKAFQDVVKSAQESLRWLCHKKILEWNEDTKLYSTTPLGRAAFGSSLSPEESLTVLDDLTRAREGFVLASDLHLVYLVTPINVDVEPDWDLYYERFMQLSALDQSVGNRVGVAEPFLMRMAHGAPVRSLNSSRNKVKGPHGKHENRLGIIGNTMLSEEQTVRVSKRFYVALILSRLVQEAPIPEVCESFKVARGMVQALQESAGRFASMVSMFCERLGWHDLEGLVAKFQNRVSFGVKAEIVELTTIPFVKGSRARVLYKAGLRTALAIAEASISEIVKALFQSSSWASEESSSQRRMQRAIAWKVKNGARKIVLDKAEEARIAAFSAFKSLGLNVPQISVSSLSSNGAGNPTRQGTEINPSRIVTSNVFAGVEHMEHVSMKPCSEESHTSDKVVSESEGEKVTETLDTKLPASAVSNPIGEEQCTLGAEIPQATIGGSLQNELSVFADHAKNTDHVVSDHLAKHGDEINSLHRYFKSGPRERQSSKIMCVTNRDSACGPGPINAVNSAGGFDSFLDLWDTTQEFYFDIRYNKRCEVNAIAPFEIQGIAICWENSPVYYIHLPKDLLWSETQRKDCVDGSASAIKINDSPSENWFEIVKYRWKRINDIMGKDNVRKFTWNLKVQLQVLKSPAVSVQRLGCLNSARKKLGLELIDGSYFLLSPVHIRDAIDICIVTWILWPDDERSSNPSLEKEVKKRLSGETAAATNRCGQWKNQMRRVAHNGCCRRVAQIRALCSVLWKLITSEELIGALVNIEIPLVNILADMELWGIGVDMEGCLRARNLLGRKLRCLEKEAYKLAGMTFSLYTAADIANVLYGHLKLPIPEGPNKGKQHPSTDKHCLDLLRNEHPIVPVIKEHRTLAKLFNCTLGSICYQARISLRTQKYTLHGHWLQTSTATGRLSMEEPNLQTVERMVDFKMSKENNGAGDDLDHYTINARDFFVPTQDNWLLLTADYSQIELRLMAHFSKDASLIELLCKPHGDIFTMIAAKWSGRLEEFVTTHERDQTKRLVYGILYGMGARTLGEQLDCSKDEAAEKIRGFMNSFPGVASWLHEAVAICCQKGYVQTIKGRKRFLSKINFGNGKEKSKAKRQAVNSICQGSAADIIKIAMINIYSVIVGGNVPEYISSHAINFNSLRGRCRIVLQVHDELVLEVDPSVVKEAALLLQISMENAVSLLVPLRVKLKVGRTWGYLEPFQSDQYE